MSHQKFASVDEYRGLALSFFLDNEQRPRPDFDDLLQNGTDWDQLFSINLFCRDGDFSHLHRVNEILLRNDETLIWGAGVSLLACAGGWNIVQDSLNQLHSIKNHVWGRFNVSLLLGMSCDRRAIDHLLDLYSLCTDPEEDGDQTLRELSYLLEGDEIPRPIFGARQRDFDPQRVAELVKGRQSQVAQLFLGNKIFEGKAFGVTALAENLLSQIEEESVQEERLYHGTFLLEAAIGRAYTALYNNELGKKTQLASALKEFLASDEANRFRPGQRYFFGHPID